jgi:hypothetical protein
MIKEAKQDGYELRKDAVSKLNFSSGLMEAHFMYNNIHTAQSVKKDMKVRADNTELGTELYTLLHSNQGDLKTYLEVRFYTLRGDFDHLTKRNDLLVESEDAKNVSSEQKELLDKKKETTIYSLRMFEKVLENLREKEGTSRNDDEKEFNEMLKFVRNAIVSLERHTPSEETITTNIIAPLREKWRIFQRWNLSFND